MSTKANKLFIYITVSVMVLLVSMSVSAAAPTMTWNTPSSNGTFYWQNFTLNLTTNINANCTYQVTYVNSTPAIPPTNFTTGQNTTNHTTNLDVESLLPANDYSVIVDCFDSTTSESTNDSKWFQRDPDCGDTVTNSWMLGHDIAGCPNNGLLLGKPGITLNCNNHLISGAGEGVIINTNGENMTITNCIINDFYDPVIGVFPFNNLTITNSTLRPGSGSDHNAINLQQATNLTITNNLINLTANAVGIFLKNSNTGTIYHNNFITTNTYFSIVESGTTNINIDNNYWGHSSCSLYSYLVDTNATTLIDHYPVSQQDNWTSYINCSDQTIFEGFYNATIYDGDGSSALSDIQGYTHYYDENNTEQNITDVLLNGVSPWRIYSTYYYPGDQIVFDVNITPANFKFIQFGIEGNSFESYTLNVTNVTGANGTAGVYRVNISNYLFNSSNEDINGSFLPRVMNFYFRTTDAQGATRVLWINALYNFTVEDALSSLGGNTTNWSDIPDMSNVSGLTFDMPGQGKIVFTAAVDLTDPEFLAALRNVATLMELNNGTIGLDSSELAALNVSANLTFYNVSGVTGLNTSTLNTTYLNDRLVVDGELCNTSVCTYTNYSNTTDTFAVSVAHWTSYSIDVTPPVISGATPSGSLSSSTTSVTLQVTTDEPATCKYGITDTAYSSLTNTFNTTGALTHQETYAVSSGNSYTFYVRCKDVANNTNTASTTITFSVASPSSGSSGGGSGRSAYTTSNLLTTYEKTIQISKEGFYYFTTAVGGDNYRLEVTSLTDTEVTLKVNGQTITLKEGESAELDVDGNGVKDTYLKLHTISAHSVSIGIKKASTSMNETSSSTSEESSTSTSEASSKNETQTATTETNDNANAVHPTENTTTTEKSTEEAKNSSHWLLWTILIVLAIIVIIFVANRNKIRIS